MIENSAAAERPRKTDSTLLTALNKCLKTTYVLVHDRNFDNFLYKIGVAKEIRRRAINLQPTIKLTRKNDVFTLTTAYEDDKVSKIRFELNTPIVRKLENGGEARCVFTAKNGKLHEVLMTNDVEITVTRVFTPSDVTVTMAAGGEKCQRYYKKIPKPGLEDFRSETSRRTVGSSSASDATVELIACESEVQDIV